MFCDLAYTNVFQFSHSTFNMALPISSAICGTIELPNPLSRCVLPCTPSATLPTLGSMFHQLCWLILPLTPPVSLLKILFSPLSFLDCSISLPLLPMLSVLATIFFLSPDRANESELVDHSVSSSVPDPMLSLFLVNCFPLILRREFATNQILSLLCGAPTAEAGILNG